MVKRMHSIAVEINEAGDIVVSQAVGDPNYPDPEVQITPEQAPLVCTWIQRAAERTRTDRADEPEGVMATYHDSDRGDMDLESISVYINAAGMVNIKISEEKRLEISPAMAKRLREQLSRAITESLTALLRPDAEA